MAQEKTYTAEEAVEILKKHTKEKVEAFEKSIKELRERELKKALIPTHRHDPGSIAGGGTEDIPAGKANPKGMAKMDLCKKCGKAHKAMEKCGDMQVVKSDLVDSKGKRSDNHTVAGSVLPDDKKSKVVEAEGSGGDISKGKSLKKEEPLMKPPVSEAQRRAMGAAASGNSTLGIPKKVGKEFINADKGGKLPEAKKAEPPMAKPPSGVNMATNVPKSKPMAPKPPAPVGTAPMAKAALAPNKMMQNHALVDSQKAAGAAPVAAAPAVALPTQAEHAARANTFAEHMGGPSFQPQAKPALNLKSPKAAGVTNAAPASKPGIFGRLMGKS